MKIIVNCSPIVVMLPLHIARWSHSNKVDMLCLCEQAAAGLDGDVRALNHFPAFLVIPIPQCLYTFSLPLLFYSPNVGKCVRVLPLWFRKLASHSVYLQPNQSQMERQRIRESLRKDNQRQPFVVVYSLGSHGTNRSFEIQKSSPLQRHQRFDISSNKGGRRSWRDEGAHACSSLIQAHLQALKSSTNKHPPTESQRQATERPPSSIYSPYLCFIYTQACCAYLCFVVCVRNHMSLIYHVLMFGACLYPITPPVFH